jgi:hypothetical protein
MEAPLGQRFHAFVNSAHNCLGINACADEDSALKLIAEHRAANRATRNTTVQGIRASKQNSAA